jgi:hypothetical protein
MNDLVNDPPEGIKVNMNDEDITDIQAYIEGPGNTLYFVSNYGVTYSMEFLSIIFIPLRFLMCVSGYHPMYTSLHMLFYRM